MIYEKRLCILIDDDPITNSITRLTITNAMSAVEVLSFTNAGAGLNFFKDDFAFRPTETAILFLNLNMPFVSGWDFLQHFENLERGLKNRVQIYILTSSLDRLDRKRAESIEAVRGYLIKPLSVEMILGI